MEKGQQMRFTDEEVAIIRSTFLDNEKLLKVLRKVFLPEYDPQAPLGQVVDLWMTLDLGGLTAEQAMVKVWARNSLITHVEQQLLQLNHLASLPVETEAEKEKRIKANSSK